eukprot:TRINITY_DN11861_c0_g1_i1.p1 TRINITY_DN11861_c0_g1~~TRINITY_DN11861_c0_g1_i1.p1  ORF type:complete len:207 (+),score=31.16 TRINITY_DN11861_c0_g1_i1:162-782(+)
MEVCARLDATGETRVIVVKENSTVRDVEQLVSEAFDGLESFRVETKGDVEGLVQGDEVVVLHDERRRACKSIARRGLEGTHEEFGHALLTMDDGLIHDFIASTLVDPGIEFPQYSMRSPLSLVSEHSPGPSLTLLLAHPDCNINAVDKYGRSALHHAALYGEHATCTMLLQHGCDRSIEDTNGRTAAVWARKEGHREAAEIIEMAP